MASLLISRPQFVQKKFSDNSQLDSLSKTPAYKCSAGNQLPLKEKLLSSLFDFFFYPERDFKDLLVQLPRCCFFVFFFLIRFILFWLHCIFIAAQGLSLVAVSSHYSLVLVPGLLIAVSALVAGSRAHKPQQLGLSCLVACGIFLVQGSNPCPCLHWQADS